MDYPNYRGHRAGSFQTCHPPGSGSEPQTCLHPHLGQKVKANRTDGQEPYGKSLALLNKAEGQQPLTVGIILGGIHPTPPLQLRSSAGGGHGLAAATSMSGKPRAVLPPPTPEDHVPLQVPTPSLYMQNPGQMVPCSLLSAELYLPCSLVLLAQLLYPHCTTTPAPSKPFLSWLPSLELSQQPQSESRSC